MAKKLRGRARTEEIKRLQSEYKKLAKTANRRMYRLEKLADQPGNIAILGYAYKNALYDIQGLPGGQGKRRFPMDISRFSAKETNIKDLRQAVVSVKNFLEKPSSTLSGLKKVYAARANTINKKYGTDFDMNSMAAFFESSYWDKMKTKYGSKTAMKAISKIQKSGKQIVDEIQDAMDRHKKIEISALKDIDGYDMTKSLSIHDKKVIENLAKMYATRDTE